MKSLWEFGKTKVGFNEAETRLPERVQSTKPRKGESMFFIPAQRVLAMRDRWPQAFGYYDPGVPFTVREFSEELRLVMADFGTEGTLFPVPRRLKDEFRELIQRHVFPGFNLKVDTQRAQKRLVLSSMASGSALPFMVWSAGQREFVPLLLGLYWLLTAEEQHALTIQRCPAPGQFHGQPGLAAADAAGDHELVVVGRLLEQRVGCLGL
jgi:hypothetical protein